MKKTNLLNKTRPKQKKRPPEESSTRRMDNDHDIFLRALMSIMMLVKLQLEYVVPIEMRQYTFPKSVEKITIRNPLKINLFRIPKSTFRNRKGIYGFFDFETCARYACG